METGNIRRKKKKKEKRKNYMKETRQVKEKKGK